MSPEKEYDKSCRVLVNFALMYKFSHLHIGMQVLDAHSTLGRYKINYELVLNKLPKKRVVLNLNGFNNIFHSDGEMCSSFTLE